MLDEKQGEQDLQKPVEAEEGQEPAEVPQPEPKDEKPEGDGKDHPLYGLLKRAERVEKTLQKQLDKALKQPKTSASGLSEEYLDEMMSLRDDGFNADEIKRIRAYATAQDISPLEASKDPFILGGIKHLREEAKAKAATPTPSKRSTTRGEKSFEDMKPQERAQSYNFQAWKERKRAGK